MIDPLARWAPLTEKPDFAGLMTYTGLPYTERAADLEGVDVAIVGAPCDDLVSDRPGARMGPRGVRAASSAPGAAVSGGPDPFEVLRMVDYGDAPVRPADPEASHAAIERIVGEVVAAGAVPITIGGDHAITAPALRACAAAHGPLGLVHFDTHTDTGSTVFGVERSHGTFIRALVEEGHVDASRYVQIGLRGYWPGAAEFAWQEERGIRSIFMREIEERGIAEAIGEAIGFVGDGNAYLTVDVDVLDPSVAPGTGTPEPGGLLARELLLAVRTVAERLALVGADVVEVAPTLLGAADVTAQVGDRVIREVLAGIATRRVAEG